LIPLSDDNPTIRTPVVTIVILVLLGLVWLLVQRGGFDDYALVASICNLGMVPGEITKLAAIGSGVRISETVACVIDAEPVNRITPITSMFLHGGWGHLLGNALFLWVFGNNVEDSMGRVRFPLFYLLCGLAAAAAHVLLNARSPIPTVGASGAISGVLGAYLVLYPRVKVKMLFIFIIFFKVIPVQAWLVLVFWFGWQVLTGLPELMEVEREVSGGVAVWAHVGGFLAGVVLVKVFENRSLVRRRTALGDARAVFKES